MQMITCIFLHSKTKRRMEKVLNKLKDIVKNLNKDREYCVKVRILDLKKEEIYWARATSKNQAEEQILQLLKKQGKDCRGVEFLSTKSE